LNLFSEHFFCFAFAYAAFRKDQAGLSEEKLLERDASTAEEFTQLPNRKRISGLFLNSCYDILYFLA
jgi:hypothetical protein